MSLALVRYLMLHRVVFINSDRPCRFNSMTFGAQLRWREFQLQLVAIDCGMWQSGAMITGSGWLLDNRGGHRSLDRDCARPRGLVVAGNVLAIAMPTCRPELACVCPITGPAPSVHHG